MEEMNTIHVQLDDESREFYERESKAHNLSISAYLRLLPRVVPRWLKIPAEWDTPSAKVMLEMRKIVEEEWEKAYGR